MPNEERKSISFEERWNDPAMVKFRETLLTGELPSDSCGNCIHNEKNGATSLRQEYDLFEEHVELDKFKLIHMDYRENNVCNMSCKMCGSSLSSTHALSQGMYGKNGILTNPTDPQLYLDNLENVRSINFAGGEPALMDSFYDVLNTIMDRDLQKNISVSLVTNGSVIMRNNDNWMEKLTQGGWKNANIAVSVGTILIAVIALVFIVNAFLGSLGGYFGIDLSIELLLGYVFAPITWLMGIPWNEAIIAGELLGLKTTLNEFVAYPALANLEPGALSDRSKLITFYSLCGFANFSSVGILISGIGAMVPERKDDLINVSFKALVAATLASCMTGLVVGCFI